MITFKTLTLRNFLSYGNVPTIIRFDKPGTTLVLGQNFDDSPDGTGSNGAGKTSGLLNGLTYAAYDKSISDISKDGLVNNINKKNMEVTLEFTKGDDTYFIKRVRKAKAGAAGNYVQLFENGKDITPDSVSNTNRKIAEIIGIPYELFVRIVTFSAIHTPFLDLPVRSHYQANQTDMIEELFSLTTLSEKASLLKDQTKDAEQRLETQLARLDQLEREHKRHNVQLRSAKKRVVDWEQNNKAEIRSIKRKLQRLTEVDVDLQREYHNELVDVDAQLREALDQQRKMSTEHSELRKKQAKQESELKHLRDDRCPYCLQKYANTEEKIKKCEDAITDYEASIAHLDEKLLIAEQRVEELTVAHKEVKSKITVHDLDELLEIKSKSAHYERRLEDLQKIVNPYIEPLEELQAVKLEEIEKDEINELKELIDHQKFLVKLLTKKDSFVRKALLHKNLPFLNKRLAHYLTELGLPHTVEFTHEMTAKISQFGRPLDFGNLSNGQRARVNLALAFAFRDVLQSLHEYINVCVLDEALDVGLDALGVQAAARMLKRKARDEGLSLFIISHRDNIDSAFDQKMVVQLMKGFSYIKEEE